MDQAVAQLVGAGLDAPARILPGHPEEVLQTLVADKGFDLLAMGASGQSGIRRLIIGSTTTPLVQAVTIPVLLYR